MSSVFFLAAASAVDARDLCANQPVRRRIDGVEAMHPWRRRAVQTATPSC